MKKLLSLLTLTALTLTLTAQNKATQRADALFGRGEFRLAAVEYEKLATTAERSKKTPPFDVGYVFNRLGESNLLIREYAKAETAFAKAYERDVKGDKFLLHFGDALLANGKTDQALVMFQKHLEENPENAEALDRIRRVQFNVESINVPFAQLNPVRLETDLNATNNQHSLAWYQAALLFSSDRSKVTGSKQAAPTRFFFAHPVYDFEQDRQTGWHPLQELKKLKTPAPDHSFAYDNNTSTYYVMRCMTNSRTKARSCNIFSYRHDQKGRLSKPNRQSFHNDNSIIGHPTLSSDGKIMFFAETRDGRTNLYMTKRTGNDTWATPMILSSVVNTGEESHPQLFRDSILFFASSGHLGMGGLDVFYTKITIDGVGHAVSGDTDLGRITFTTPVNLGAPINSGADDFSMLMRHAGHGGFFISNRSVDGGNLHSIYSFAQEPYVFDSPGNYLVARVPGGDMRSAAAALVSDVRPARVDTIFIEQFVGEGNEQAQAVLQQRDEQISLLVQDLTSVRELLLNCQAGLAQAQQQTQQAQQQAQQAQFQAQQTAVSAGDPTSIPVAATPVSTPAATPVTSAPVATPTAVPTAGIVYRVQVAAATRPADYRTTFAALHRAMPHLQMETIHDTDGYFRYVTLPYATFAEADAVRRQIQALGFQCFVGGYRGNQRVSISVR